MQKGLDERDLGLRASNRRTKSLHTKALTFSIRNTTCIDTDQDHHRQTIAWCHSNYHCGRNLSPKYSWQWTIRSDNSILLFSQYIGTHKVFHPLRVETLFMGVCDGYKDAALDGWTKGKMDHLVIADSNGGSLWNERFPTCQYIDISWMYALHASNVPKHKHILTERQLGNSTCNKIVKSCCFTRGGDEATISYSIIRFWKWRWQALTSCAEVRERENHEPSLLIRTTLYLGAPSIIPFLLCAAAVIISAPPPADDDFFFSSSTTPPSSCLLLSSAVSVVVVLKKNFNPCDVSHELLWP